MISCVWTGPTAFRTKLSYAPIATYEAYNWAHAGGWWLQRHAREYIHTTNIHTYMFVLVNFAALADKLSSSAECRIRNRVFGTEPPADWMPADNPTKLSRIKLKNLNSTARPYDQRAFSPLDPIAIWPITLSTVSERLCLFVKNWLLTVLGVFIVSCKRYGFGYAMRNSWKNHSRVHKQFGTRWAKPKTEFKSSFYGWSCLSPRRLRLIICSKAPKRHMLTVWQPSSVPYLRHVR